MASDSNQHYVISWHEKSILTSCNDHKLIVFIYIFIKTNKKESHKPQETMCPQSKKVNTKIICFNEFTLINYQLIINLLLVVGQ